MNRAVNLDFCQGSAIHGSRSLYGCLQHEVVDSAGTVLRLFSSKTVVHNNNNNNKTYI